MKRQGKRIGAWILSLALAMGVFAAADVTTAQAAKGVTVTTQAELDAALKDASAAKITVKNTADLELSVKAGTYKTSIVLDTRAGKSLTLKIAKGVKLSKAVTVKGAGTDTVIRSESKVKLTVNSTAIVRLYEGAEGSTVTDKCGSVKVLNYTTGDIFITKAVPKPTKSVKNIIVSWDTFFGKYILITDDWKSPMENAVIYLDGKLATGEWSFFERSSTLTLDTPLTEGEHAIIVEAAGYKEPFKTKITFESEVNGLFCGDPWIMNSGDLRIYLIPDMLDCTKKYMVDGVEVQPSNGGWITGDGTYIEYFSVPELSAGEHTITVYAEGYEPSSATFKVE